MPTAQKYIQRANQILKRATDMLAAKRIYSDKWPEYERVYKMVQESRQGEDQWRAVLPDTWTFATIKTAQAAFVDSKVVPTIIRHKDDPKSKAEDLRDLYTDIAEKGNLDMELYYARLDAFKLGTGFLTTLYHKQTRKVWDIKKFDPKKDEFVWEQKDIDEFDDPRTTRVSPYLVLVDDLARQGEYRDAIVLEVLGRDEAEARYGKMLKGRATWDDVPTTGTLLKELTPQSTTQIAETDGTGLRGTEFEGISEYPFFAPGFEWSDEYVEIIHYWNKGIMTPSGSLDSYEVLVNGFPLKVDTASKPSPIPYIHKQIPLVIIPYSPYSKDEFWSAGIVEIGKAEAAAIQKHREMMSDRQKISLFSPAFSDVSDEIDQKQLKLQPLSIIRTKGGAPRQFQIPGITNADLQLRSDYEMSFKRATGIDERILGLESGGPKLTATEVSFLREAAMKRLREFAFLYKNALLQGEIKLKLSLFKQYYSNPLKKEGKVKDDGGMRAMAAKFKEFKVKTGNTYIRKEFNPNFFESEVDVDLDLQLLLPMTQAQMVTLWSQILRDAVPFVQAGIIDIDLEKVFKNYVEALGSNIESLKLDRDAKASEMAEAEHQLYGDENTSKQMADVLPNGTQPPFLTEAHVMKHNELLDGDPHMDDVSRGRLLAHIKKDIENLKKLQVERQQIQQLTPQAVATVGGLPGTPQPANVPATPPVAPTIPNV